MRFRGEILRYVLIGIIVVSFMFLKPAVVPATTCSGITLTNCLSDRFQWCAYDGNSTWDTLVAADEETTDSGETEAYFPCNNTSSCYFIGTEFVSVVWFCSSSTVSGFADCGDYACVDESDGVLVWNTGDSEYCCSDNTCTTDCSD